MLVHFFFLDWLPDCILLPFSCVLPFLFRLVSSLANATCLKPRPAHHHHHPPFRLVLIANSKVETQADLDAEVVEMIYAAAEGDVTTLKSLVARGANVNAGDYDRRTPLHLAAAEGQMESVKYLIVQGLSFLSSISWNG